MNIFQRIARALTSPAPLDELQSELRMRRPRAIVADERQPRRKTKKHATHKHREAGEGLHRRSYLPGCGPFGAGRRAARA